jgi:hypothetical protein
MSDRPPEMARMPSWAEATPPWPDAWCRALPRDARRSQYASKPRQTRQQYARQISRLECAHRQNQTQTRKGELRWQPKGT